MNLVSFLLGVLTGGWLGGGAFSCRLPKITMAFFTLVLKYSFLNLNVFPSVAIKQADNFMMLDTG